MSRKLWTSNHSQITDGDMSADITTADASVTDVEAKDRALFHASWVGSSPVGSISIEFSNDKSNWIALDFGSVITVTGNSGYHLVMINMIAFKYVRAKYNRTSGTGTLNVKLKAVSEGA